MYTVQKKQIPEVVGWIGRRSELQRIAAVVIWLCLLGIGATTLATTALYAQETLGSYTVQSGDTLAVIAQRFGVALDDLIALNNIADRNLISVGQVLLIPSSDATLTTVPTAQVAAMPGDTLVDIARRFGQDPQLLTSLNPLSMTTRLFPGQPIALPAGQPLATPLRFGAIHHIAVPATLIQGRTGQLTIDSRHPISVSASWNGLPLPMLPVNAERTTQVALLPVPALIAPAAYTLTVGYTTTTGIFLRQDRSITVLAGPYDSQEILLPDEKGELLAPEIAESELALMSATWSQVTPTWWWRTPFTRPIDSQYATTSPFGTRRSYNGGPYSSYHAGQDFGAPAGVPILAPGAGRVALAAPLQVRGNAVLLDHGGGIYTGYWHMSELYVTEGQMVEAGEVLGLVGTTGLSTGAHLHWELRIYGIGVDPMQFLDEPLLQSTQ
ncbi:MAG: peptidoglycan DD-metalloendopeptidase family protein [Caldilineaceae bacterium]